MQFFVQYAPYDVKPSVGSWSDEKFKNDFADRVFAIVDEYAPGTCLFLVLTFEILLCSFRVP